MSDDLLKRLTAEEKKSYNCRHLLPEPGAEVVEQWAKWLCEERGKLAKARGLLYSLKFGEELHEEELKVLDELLGYTKST